VAGHHLRLATNGDQTIATQSTSRLLLSLEKCGDSALGRHGNTPSRGTPLKKKSKRKRKRKRKKRKRRKKEQEEQEEKKKRNRKKKKRGEE